MVVDNGARVSPAIRNGRSGDDISCQNREVCYFETILLFLGIHEQVGNLVRFFQIGSPLMAGIGFVESCSVVQ